MHADKDKRPLLWLKIQIVTLFLINRVSTCWTFYSLIKSGVCKNTKPLQEKGRTALFMCCIQLNLADQETVGSNISFCLSYYHINQRLLPMKKRKLRIAFMLLLASLFARAQEEFIEPVSHLLTRIPIIQLTGGVVIVQARLDDFPDTLNFILDTGSSGISLDSSTVAYFNLKPEQSDRTIRGIAGIKKVGFLYNRKLRFPDLMVDSLNFHVNDYSVLTSVYGEQIDGIIGYSMLNRYIVKINYDSLKLDICSKGTIRYPKGGFLFKPVISTLPVQSARVRDEHTYNVRFLHDIGAGVCLMLSQDFIDDSSLLQKKRKLFPKDGEGIGGKVRMNLTVVKELKLGPYRFRNVPTY